MYNRAYRLAITVPPLLWVTLFLLVPYAILFAYSFWSVSEAQNIVRNWTSANYRELVSNPLYLQVLFRSMKIAGAVTVLNVWASWCVPCHDEAPLLVKLAADPRIRVVGINYKDQPDNARRFLGRYGNPFVANGVDANGRAAIEWGVYGVPETFIIDRDGRIAFKLIGPITPENFARVLKPEIEKALVAMGP